VTADSVPRQPICRFTVSRPPPFRLSFHLCVSRCTGARVFARLLPVFVPCGIFRGTCPSEWSHVRSAVGSVARVCLLTPLLSRTTLCRLSLLHHRRRWVSLNYHEAPCALLFSRGHASSYVIPIVHVAGIVADAHLESHTIFTALERRGQTYKFRISRSPRRMKPPLSLGTIFATS
jgi:hypothetical protein